MVNAASGNDELYAIGYADSADMAVQSRGFDPGTVVIKPTLVGDANLDGVVNFSDFQLLAANFNQSNTSWDQGNFNYGTKTNYTDFQLLAANFNDSASLDSAQFNAMNQVANSGGFNLTPNSDGLGFAFVPMAKVAAAPRPKTGKHGGPSIAAVVTQSYDSALAGVFGDQKIGAEDGRLDLGEVTDIFGR
jgi:hypothetical protein